MPKYIAKAYLVHKGKIIPTDGEVELTKEQGDRLGDKVELINLEEQKGEKSLQEHTVDELKIIAEERGIEDYTKLKKEDLIKTIEASEQE
ncbi:Rho termination factor N-terminal domain-containing protein [Oceanobacillus profundus]|uniref:Rho termination factor-like N-terminal domain-containing protein n=1 Tax=Oceanobacillus profundus TaxID=372463 RepID=A0A417YJN1_9BACI|nr:Rho termination factor N-terminal domain-containing protein [Oceanobacillus profundus]RHW33524.1 hypothetical protein D1B32_05635 [Oceanobacillus profundus]